MFLAFVGDHHARIPANESLQELKPGSKQNMLAMTGIITATTEKHSLITLLQDMEYIHGQLFERSVESGCGAVTCLPGALTMLRFSAFRKMAKYYFADKAEQCDDLFDYGKCHLGEDRWLTHLFMIGAKERYQIQLCTGAFCKTEAVQTYKSLLKQRRRWFLGFITNEVCMLTDIRLWKRYPLLCIVRFMQNTIRTTALLFFIMVLSIITTSNKIKNLPVGFIAVSLGLNWLLMLYFGAKLRRFKIWLYPIMFIINPFFNWVYMVYGIFTAGQRTWGGPRADAGKADAGTTPQQAIEHAEATGDDLNVVPESFKPAVHEQHPEKPLGTVPLQPTERLEGRFAPAERLPGGWYLQNNDSGLTLPNMLPRDPNVPHIPLHPRDSFDSFVTSASANNSVYMPRRVESIMGDEDRRKYLFAQQAQRDSHISNSEPHRQSGHVYEMSDDGDHKGDWADSAESLASDPYNPYSYNGNGGGQGDYLQPATNRSNNTQRSPSHPASFLPTHPSGLSAEVPPSGYSDFSSPPEPAALAPHQQSERHHRRSPSPLAQPGIRSARSPLGRMPLMRTQTGDEPSIELEQRQQQREPLVRGASPRPVGEGMREGRGRRGSESSSGTAAGKQQRARLSKARPQ